MDNILSETSVIDNYSEYLKSFIFFQNKTFSSKKDKVYNINVIFNDDLMKNLNMNNEFIKYKSDLTPLFDYTNDFNYIIILKNNDKKYLTIELDYPKFDLIDDTELFNDFYEKNIFLKLINLKNKLSIDDIDNEEYIYLKNEYEKNRLDKYRLLEKMKVISNKLYNEYINLSIQEIITYKSYLDIYSKYIKSPNKVLLKQLLLLNFITLTTNTEDYGDYIISEGINYILLGDNILYNFNKNKIIKSDDKHFKKIMSNKKNKPLNNKINNKLEEIKKQIVYNNSNEEYESSITIKYFDNDELFKKYINENIVNSNKILDTYEKIKEDTPKKEPINIDINDKKYDQDVLIISNDIKLNVNEYSYETNNKNEYKLSGYLWRSLLDNSNNQYSFVYNDLLFSSVNHTYEYLDSESILYSMNYDTIHYVKKDKENYIGYSEQVIFLDNVNIKEDILLNKFLQNKELLEILLNTNDALLKDENDNDLTELMNIRKKIKEMNNKEKIKTDYLEYEKLKNDYSDIIIRFFQSYDKDTQLSSIIIDEVEKLELYEKYKSKFKKEYQELFEIIKHNYFILL